MIGYALTLDREAEFWLSGGKVVLIFALFFFTFITMVGGNPQGDAYGFRYWNNVRITASISAVGPCWTRHALTRNLLRDSQEPLQTTSSVWSTKTTTVSGNSRVS